MKHLFFFLAAALIMSGSLSAQELEAAKTDGAIMEFESTLVDYGSIDQHSEPLRKFIFSNAGTEPLVITAAKGSCGCTVPSYPKEPILPGASADIEVRYDTKRIGAFTKTVTLTTNAVNSSEAKPAGTFLLTIKGKVSAKEAAPGSSPTIIPLGSPE